MIVTKPESCRLPATAILTLMALLRLAPLGAVAQERTDLTAAYPDSVCGSCAEWNQPHTPFRIHGSTYYVGTHGLGAVLITSDEGHVLIDGGLPDSAPQILGNIRALGFDPADVALILNSHVHFDHAGGIAAVQSETGARVAASPESVPVLESGRAGPRDPQFGILLDFPPVPEVDRFEPGDTLRVGNISVASHATGGHTPGGTTWSWRSCDAAGCVQIVFADSQTPISADGFRYTSDSAYPGAIEDFRRGHDTLERLACDILITTHAGASSLWERMESGAAGLVDATACKRYAANARHALERRIERELQN